MKQFVGKLILGVMREEGFVIAKKGNRVEDGMFERGTSYRRVSANAADGTDTTFLQRLVAILTPTERSALSQMLS